MQRLSQNDPRWKFTRFGIPGSTLTLGQYGCTLTAIANLTNNLTPLQLARQSQFIPTANLVWSSINIPEVKYVAIIGNNLQILRERISQGYGAIIEMPWTPAKHWMTVVKTVAGGFECIDPLNPQTNTIITNSRITNSAIFKVSNNQNMSNKPDYLSINNKIIEDFSKHHGDVFGRRTNDYKHQEFQTPGAGIRDRFRVLIRKIRNQKEEILNLEKEIRFNSEFNKDSQGLIDNLKNEKELLQTRINELENEVEETNQGWQEVADEYIKELEDLSITETKEKFDFNQLFIGISRWWNTQGGSDLIIGGVLSALITILPAIFENAPDGQANFALAIIPLLNSLIATFRKNSNKKEVLKFKKQIDELEEIIKK